MNIATLLWLIFSTLDGIPVAEAPAECAWLLDQDLIQVRPGKIPVYVIAPRGYARIVRL